MKILMSLMLVVKKELGGGLVGLDKIGERLYIIGIILI